MRIWFAAAVLCSTWQTICAEERGFRLNLPRDLYAVVGQETAIYFDNLVLTQTPERFEFKVDCEIGESQNRRWAVTAAAKQTGTHDLTVTVSGSSGQPIQRAVTRLNVVDQNAGENHSVRILLVGDSLTHATLYPNELARLLSLSGNPAWKMLGTHQPKNAAKGVRHEGYGGWTWARFVTRFEPEPDGTHRKRSSPFVFLNSDGKPELNVPRYFEVSTKGEKPDVVFFLLGINDCFSANPDDPKSIDVRIDVMFGHMDRLLTAFRKAAPETTLAVCVTTPPNSRESGFTANYKGRYHRWGWKRIQHRITERLLEKFNRQDRGIYLVPTHLNLDPVDGYPINNGVHPNAFGYRQIAVSLHAWLKWWSARPSDVSAAIRDSK